MKEFTNRISNRNSNGNPNSKLISLACFVYK